MIILLNIISIIVGTFIFIKRYKSLVDLIKLDPDLEMYLKTNKKAALSILVVYDLLLILLVILVRCLSTLYTTIPHTIVAVLLLWEITYYIFKRIIKKRKIYREHNI